LTAFQGSARLCSGITTISTDFKKMGMLAARMTLERKKEKIQFPFQLRLKPSS